MSLYPNPAQGTLQIEIKGLETASRLIILNIMGEVKDEMQIGGSGKLELDVHSYPNGLYIARLDSDDGIRIKSTFVVNR